MEFFNILVKHFNIFFLRFLLILGICALIYGCNLHGGLGIVKAKRILMLKSISYPDSPMVELRLMNYKVYNSDKRQRTNLHSRKEMQKEYKELVNKSYSYIWDYMDYSERLNALFYLEIGKEDYFDWNLGNFEMQKYAKIDLTTTQPILYIDQDSIGYPLVLNRIDTMNKTYVYFYGLVDEYSLIRSKDTIRYPNSFREKDSEYRGNLSVGWKTFFPSRTSTNPSFDTLKIKINWVEQIDLGHIYKREQILKYKKEKIKNIH